jgi:hypothetical protein
MDRKPAVQVPDVPGIDLDYRPRNYFWAVDLKVPLTSSIAGETRRQMVRALLDWDTPIPDGLDAEVLDEAMREAWGAVHPSHMGGEYLPPLCKGEVEIARISLQSVTCDQISVRARRSSKRIVYRIADEYESGYICRPAGSTCTLSLRKLTALMESACEGSSIIFRILNMNLRDSATAELEEFVSVTSDFYPDLGRYYRALTDAWLEDRIQESRGDI